MRAAAKRRVEGSSEAPPAVICGFGDLADESAAHAGVAGSF